MKPSISIAYTTTHKDPSRKKPRVFDPSLTLNVQGSPFLKNLKVFLDQMTDIEDFSHPIKSFLFFPPIHSFRSHFHFRFELTSKNLIPVVIVKSVKILSIIHSKTI